MRPGLVRNVGLGIGALALVWLAACNDDPLSFDVKDSSGILTNPSAMVIPAGRTGKLQAYTVNEGGAPTFEQMSAAVDATCGSGAITVAEDPDDQDLVDQGIVPPGRFVVTGGSTLGQSCVTLTGGGLTAEVDVTVVAEAILVLSAPDTLRAGESGQVVAGLVDLNGDPVGPYDPADAGWTSEASDVADFTDDVGNFSTEVAGTALFHVTWIGQDANGTIVEGVVLEADHVLTVIPNVPDTAAFAGAAADTVGGTPVFAAMGLGEEQTVEVIVYDALGNVNTYADEVTGPCTVNSSNPLVATATCDVIPGAEATDPVAVEVVVSSVGPGTSDIDGTLVTSTGPLDFGPNTVTVIAPSITSLSAASGGFAETVTINGAGLSAAGFVTLVYADGERLGNFTVVSDAAITAQMPTYNVAGIHDITVEVAGIASNAVTWEQTDACNALDFPEEPGFDGPFVPASLPLRCDGTASGPQDDWFFTPISTDAFGGAESIDLTYAPTWGPPLKDIDFYWGETDFTFHFEVDQPPETATVTIEEVGTHIWIMDDFAGFDGDLTPQPYTIVVTIDD